jgi:two-component system, NtrC family, sensor kinase
VPVAHNANVATILLVDDDEFVRQITAAELMDAGHHVLETASAHEALAKLREGDKVDMLVTDVVMPGGMGGVELANEAQRMCPVLPILLVTGYDLRLARAEKIRFPILMKPYRPAELRARVQQLLQERASRQRTVPLLPREGGESFKENSALSN